jgi:hypothetical protein
LAEILAAAAGQAVDVDHASSTAAGDASRAPDADVYMREVM